MPTDPKLWQGGRHVNEGGLVIMADLVERSLTMRYLVPP